MAETAPQPSTEERISRWLSQEKAPANDVSPETSPETPEESELEAAAEEDDSGGGEPNAQLEGDDEPEGDGESVQTFAELAKRLEVDEDTLAKHLRVAGRDGQEVTLHDVLTAYRAPVADTEKTKARLAELEGKEADFTRAAEELRQTAQSFAQQLKAREPDWAKLQAEHPERYLAARLEWMEHERQLERAAQQYEMAQNRARAEQQAQMDAQRRDEARKLQAAVPEWSDHKVFAADLAKIEKYATTQGYTAAQFEQASATDWLTVRKAMLYDELQGKKTEVLKKVRALPKMLAPGAAGAADRGASARNAQADAERFEKFKTSGKVEDAAELIAHRLSVSSRRAAGRALAAGRRS